MRRDSFALDDAALEDGRRRRTSNDGTLPQRTRPAPSIAAVLTPTVNRAPSLPPGETGRGSDRVRVASHEAGDSSSIRTSPHPAFGHLLLVGEGLAPTSSPMPRARSPLPAWPATFGLP